MDLSMIKREICSAEQWDAAMTSRIQRHILQSTQWASFKSRTGWLAHYILWHGEDGQVIGGASVLEKVSFLPLVKIPIKILYAPRGPVLAWENADLADKVISDLILFTREQGAIFIKIDPEVFRDLENEDSFQIQALGRQVEQQLVKQHWQISSDQIQFRNTFWLSLAVEEAQLLADMKQKTRYNIRLAEKKGVIVRQAAKEDFHLLYQMYAETAERDHFIIRTEEYYTDLWTQFMDQQMAVGLIAEFEGEPLAGLVLFVYENRSWYFYGMSVEKHRNLMPTYLLQWEAIKISKQLGCTLYDLWGAPDEITSEDSMFGVFRFKQGLGSSLIQGIGAWDYTAKPFYYRIYSIVLPQFLTILRRLRRSAIHREVADQ
jgi:peptidoglycan pentaglycine glycine transferase (the first glycine)